MSEKRSYDVSREEKDKFGYEKYSKVNHFKGDLQDRNIDERNTHEKGIKDMHARAKRFVIDDDDVDDKWSKKECGSEEEWSD